MAALRQALAAVSPVHAVGLLREQGACLEQTLEGEARLRARRVVRFFLAGLSEQRQQANQDPRPGPSGTRPT